LLARVFGPHPLGGLSSPGRPSNPTLKKDGNEEIADPSDLNVPLRKNKYIYTVTVATTRTMGLSGWVLLLTSVDRIVCPPKISGSCCVHKGNAPLEPGSPPPYLTNGYPQMMIGIVRME